MKKPNCRSKRASVADLSPQSAIRHDKQQQQQHCDDRVDDLEKENENLKRENEYLKRKLDNASPDSVDSLQNHKEREDADSRKFILLEEEVMHLKKKLSGLSQLSGRKQRSSQKNGDAGLSTINEVQRLKAQKVQLLCKMKLESVQFRLLKASLEKQVLQLRKEQRRKDYEIRKLLAFNEKQKLVLQRKKEEAIMATKRLKELLESRKASSHRTSDAKSNQGPGVQGVELELKIGARVEEIRADFERQMEEMSDEVRKYEEEAEMLREENFRLLLQEKEVDCIVRESELKDLKEEVIKLSNVVNQLGISRSEVHRKQQVVARVKPAVSYGSSYDLLNTPESEYSGGNNVVVRKSTERVCCSCGKRSLCKTSKCECVAASGSCSTGCGCTATKCTNRESSSIEMEDNSLQQEVAQDLVQTSGTSETGESIVVSRTADLDKDNVPRRKPLSEIGNTTVNPSPKKHGRKMRGRRPVAQLDIVESSYSITEIAENTKKAEGIDMAVAEKPIRLTRGKRAAV